MNIQSALARITLLGVCIAMFMGGCVTPQKSATEESSRRFDGAEAGERVTRAELDQLTRGFADRYVGLLYSVCDELKEDNPDPAQRRAAQTLLVDNASNVYDIASNADAFTRVLDLVVITTLVSQEWDDDGRAVAVFGQQGQALADALSQARVESRLLATRVLTDEQLEILDSLLQTWREENPKVVRASFVRFSNFAIGRGESAATRLLEAQGLFAEIGQAGQSVDEARLLGERTFYRLKRESTLLRWQVEAMKYDMVATPELNTALADIHSVSNQIEQLPATIAAERQAILTGLDARLQDANETVANMQSALEAGNTFVVSLKPTIESLNELLTTADALYARHTASTQSKAGKEGHAFDIREYEQMAKSVTLAVEQMNEMLTTADGLVARYTASTQSMTGEEGHAFDIREYEQMAKSVTLAVEQMNEMLTTADGLVARYTASTQSMTGEEGHAFDIREYEQTAENVMLAVEQMNEMLTTADSLVARYAALEQSKTGKEGDAFDIREYEQTAENVTLAVEQMNELLTTTEDLLKSPDLKHGIKKVNDSVDGRIMKVSDQSQVVMNAFFWRVCALLGVLFAMLIVYRLISLLLMRNLKKEQAADGK